LFDPRVDGPENLYSVTQKDFCNIICHKRMGCRPECGWNSVWRALR
jgi:hypothetical protein